MLDIDLWLENYLTVLKRTFGERIWFVGLQGSYGRNEATDSSDIDLVVILDQLVPEDIEAYGCMLEKLEYREKLCGFLSGLEELLCWEPSDLFQFCHDTTPILGSLDPILAKVGMADVDRTIRIGACNIYHGCVHNMLYEKDAGILQELYKAATFVIRAIVFRRAGLFCRKLLELKNQADEGDGAIVSGYLDMLHDGAGDFRKQSNLLFAWSKGVINSG